MSDIELTVEQIDAEIARLKAMKKAQHQRTYTPKQPTSKARRVQTRCTLCGKEDRVSNMLRISHSDYAHASCIDKGRTIKREETVLVLTLGDCIKHLPTSNVFPMYCNTCGNQLWQTKRVTST